VAIWRCRDNGDRANGTHVAAGPMAYVITVKFVDVISASGKRKGVKGKTGNADKAVDYIRSLYAIEKEAEAQGLNDKECYERRKEKAGPVLDEFREWLERTCQFTPPKGLLGGTISYALKQWGRLIRYLEDRGIRPDNNLAEDAIRPFVVGRKNWLFSGHSNVAKASAALYSLIGTAKANNIEPYRYPCCLFERVPSGHSIEDTKPFSRIGLTRPLSPCRDVE
jgi:transposase